MHNLLNPYSLSPTAQAISESFPSAVPAPTRLPGMKAEEFDEKFEAGEDLTELMDFSITRRPNRKKQAIELKLPIWMIHQLEAEAQKQGILPKPF